MTDPYADNAHAYLLGGWHPFPLPYAKKVKPPVGFTGYTAQSITSRQVDAWLDNGCKSAGPAPWNIGLHLTETVLGIDVDHYDDKTGGDTLAQLEADLGPLPATWVSSARTGRSGIRFFRVPAGRVWVGGLPGSIDIISHNDRFAVIWPSVHDKTGNTYAWTDPDGFPAEDVPSIDLLPDLPAAWVDHLDNGSLADRDLKKDLADSDAWEWLQDSTEPGPPCRAMRKVIREVGLSLEFGNDHHGAARGPVLSVIRMGEQGHVGTVAALQEIREILEDSFEGHTRSFDEREWVRLVVGAVAIVTVEDQRTEFDDRGCCGPEAEETADLDDVLSDEGDTFSREKGSTWGRIDLTEIIGDIVSGAYQAPMPTVGRFGDKALFYRDAVNSVAGPPSSGKTWVVLVAVKQEMEAGNDVVYIDMENGLGPFVSRLINDMGIDPAVIKDHLTYIYPEEKLGTESGVFLKEALRGVSPTLIAIDTTGVSLALEGASPNDDDAVALWFAKIPSKFARRTGAAVVLIDHVTHSAETRDRPIGSQRKLAAVDTQFMLHHGQRFSRSVDGVADITCPKDRHGRHDPGRPICRLSMRHVDEELEATLVDVEAVNGDDSTLNLSAKAREVLEKVRDHYYENHGQEDPEGNVMDARPNITEIRGMVTGNNTAIKLAVEELVRNNLLERTPYAGTTRGRTPMVYSPLVDSDFDKEEEGTE